MRKVGTFYLERLPNAISHDLVLVHNHIDHGLRTPIGLNGFRAWLSPNEEQYVRCACGRAARLGKHYRTKAR